MLKSKGGRETISEREAQPQKNKGPKKKNLCRLTGERAGSESTCGIILDSVRHRSRI